MKLFLELDVVGEDLVNHVSKWLRGRPRWAATFLETFLYSKQKRHGYPMTRGVWKDVEMNLIEALDRYVDVMTTGGSEDTEPRHSWSNQVEETSAYASIKRVMGYVGTISANVWGEVQQELKRAISSFVLSGNPVDIKVGAAEMIEKGIASVVSYKPGLKFSKCVLDEPLIVQAGINFLNVDKVVSDMLRNQSRGGQGDSFELYILPKIQANLVEILNKQLNTAFIKYKEYRVPMLSAYGVFLFARIVLIILSTGSREPSQQGSKA